MQELLSEANNRIKHLYDNPDLTFGQIKDIFTAAANGSLEGTEKVSGDKILLSFSINEGKIKCAKDKDDIITGGLDPKIFAKRILKEDETFEDQIFIDGILSFEKAIQGLDQQTQIELFGPDTNIYYSASVIHPVEKNNTKNIISYDTKKIIIHDLGHNEYNRITGDKQPIQMFDRINKLKKIISSFQDDSKHENYSVQINAIKRLKGLNDKTPLNSALNRLNSILLSINTSIKNDELKLTDGSTINDYMIARVYVLLNSILSKAPEDAGNLAPSAKANIAKRLFGVKGISVSDIRKKLSPIQYDYVKQNILDNEKNILLNAIQPVELLITDFSSEMLKNLHSAFILDNSKEVEKLKEKLKSAIDEIQKYGDYKDILTVKRQMQKLKSLDKVTTATEGFIFDYDGMTYKFMGNFAPIKQILNIFNKIKNETYIPPKHLKEHVINESLLDEIIRKRGNKYCLLSKKTKRNLGCYRSRAGAEKREKQVNYFKHIKKEDAGAGGVGAASSSASIVGAPFVVGRKNKKEEET